MTDKTFNQAFQLIIYEQLEDELRGWEIVLEDQDTFIRP